MKVVIQRVKSSSVLVDSKVISKIKEGLVLLVGISSADTYEDIDYIVNKVLNLRIFNDSNEVMNKSILDINGKILSVSQFTLQAVTKNGNRPSYINAMRGEDALSMYNYFNEKLNEHIKTSTGIFGADMTLNIENDGPVTIIIDSKNK